MSEAKGLEPRDLLQMVAEDVSRARLEDNQGSSGRAPSESNILFIGPRGSGKSSIIQNFLSSAKSDDAPKPTVALEYSFWRKSGSGGAAVKDVCHVWELAGGSKISELTKIPISSDKLCSLTLAIVVDLSKPGEAIPELLRSLSLVRERVGEAVRELGRGKKGGEEVEKLLQKAKARYGEGHEDQKIVDPSPIPMIILAHKHDVFKEQETSKRKALNQALRYISHLQGATLLSSSIKEKTLVANFRGVINAHVFKGEARRTAEAEMSKPLLIPAGSDSFQNIGPPKAGRSISEVGSSDNRMKAWLPFVAETFPPTETAPEAKEEDEGNRYPEPTIDAMFQQKEEELARYKKEVERRQRLKAGTDGSSGGREGEESTKAEGKAKASASKQEKK